MELLELNIFIVKPLEAVGGDESKIDESQFRYPGPKPNSKETGILMICEAIDCLLYTSDAADE